MRKQAGFTLMEIMFAAVIVAILAAIAIPIYTNQIDRAARADAAAALIGLASSMERRFSENGNYCDSADDGGIGAIVANCGLGAGAGSNDTGVPAFYAQQVPINGGNANYVLTIEALDPTSFTIQATRDGIMLNDECGDFTLTHTGQRGLVNNVLAIADCWR